MRTSSADDDASSPELGYVGVPVKATDPNAADILTYTLSGADADKFDIISENDVDTTDLDEEGQIRLKAGTKLNYESNKKTYMVTVTATDPSQRRWPPLTSPSTSPTSTNPRSFTAPSEGDVDKTVKENAGSLNIYTFQSHRPGAPEGLLVAAQRHSRFPRHEPGSPSATEGALSLRDASPDYEAAGDEALGDDKQYVVHSQLPPTTPPARASTEPDDEDPIKTSMKTVTVKVTEDVEETGTITTWHRSTPMWAKHRDGYP